MKPRIGRLFRVAGVFLQALRARLTRRRIPVKVLLQITGRCNLRCAYCYAPFDKYSDLEDLPTDRILGLIDLLYSRGMRWLWIVGGEPLIRDDLETIVSHAQRKGIFTDLSTNGLLIEARHLPLLRKLDSVSVSFDGSAEAHDAARGTGSFGRLKTALTLLVSEGIRPRLHCILSRKTKDTLDELDRFASGLGILYNYCEILKGTEDPDNLSPEEHEAFYRAYLRKSDRTGSASANSRTALRSLLRWPRDDFRQVMSRSQAAQHPAGTFVPCRCGDLQCFVDVDGGVYSCSGRWSRGKNIFRDGWDAAWQALAERECVSCRCLGMTEASLLLSLDPSWFLPAIRNIGRM